MSMNDLNSPQLKEKCKSYGLTLEEYQRICTLLGRAPEGVEWAIFSALWSEHCSYKSSKWHLRQFASTLNKRVLQSEGENAGVLDLGQGERVVFKMESHNHPSFIYPYHGAATGVGGILRDIFTMGAKPIALADYLCFGAPYHKRTPSLLEGVVRGIGDYGNAVGVPTVTGFTEFHSGYQGNILVNAFALGLLGPGEKVQLSAARGVGNLVFYVGAKTGGDGIHGATMASASFEKKESKKSKRNKESKESKEAEESEEREKGSKGIREGNVDKADKANKADGVDGVGEVDEREGLGEKLSCVQVGDPFLEKLLMDACLEAIREGLVVSLQDMGAAGLTSSAFEMCEKGKIGMDLHLDRVPLRDSRLGPEEILLSESQERMLLVCQPQKEEALCTLFKKWGLEAVRIGTLCKESRKKPQVRLFWKGQKLTELSPEKVVTQAPVYQRPYEQVLPKPLSPSPSSSSLPSISNLAPSFSAPSSSSASLSSSQEEDQPLPPPFPLPLKGKNLWENLCWQMSHWALAPRHWIYSQYDQRVGAKTMWDASHSLALLRLPHSGRLLGISLGGRPSLLRLHCQWGAIDAIAYPTLKMAVKGLKSLAFTDCLNFGNPENKKVMGDFVLSVQSITEACRVLDTPVVSGNVSFYNENTGAGGADGADGIDGAGGSSGSNGVGGNRVGGNIDPTPATACVGIQEQNLGTSSVSSASSVPFIPSDTLAEAVAGDKIFLLHCPLLEYASLTAEIHGFKPLFRGALDLKVLKALRDFLLDLVESANTSPNTSAGASPNTSAGTSPNISAGANARTSAGSARSFLKASRMVESGGFLYTLLKMAFSRSNPQTLGLALDSFSWAPEKEKAAFQEVLYQALLVIDGVREIDFISKFHQLKAKHQVDFLELHRVGTCLSDATFLFEGRSWELAPLKASYQKAWERHFPHRSSF